MRKRFAVVRSGMMGGGFSESADADCGAVMAVVTVNGAMRAVCRMFLLLSECKDEVLSSDEVDACSRACSQDDGLLLDILEMDDDGAVNGKHGRSCVASSSAETSLLDNRVEHFIVLAVIVQMHQ